MIANDSTRTEKLLKRIRSGDPAAVDQLIAAHRRYLRVLIDLRMDDALRVRIDPSDVVQETQLVAAQRLDDFLERRPTSFRIWLRRKALERLIDLRRRHLIAEKRSVRREVHLSNQSSMALIDGIVTRSPQEIADRHEFARKVRESVQQLNPADREILVLRHVEGLRNTEVAEALEIIPTTASQRYGRALRRLREELIRRGVIDHEQ